MINGLREGSRMTDSVTKIGSPKGLFFRQRRKGARVSP